MHVHLSGPGDGLAAGIRTWQPVLAARGAGG
jgi:hypothetical protein